ncbi:MAG: hypothetical protein V3U67_05605 [Gemmatimonadota bacterium]
MEDFTIFIVIGLYWLFSAMRKGAKKQNKGSRPRKSVTGSLAERIRAAQRAAERKLADWEEEQRRIQAAKTQSEGEESAGTSAVLSRPENTMLPRPPDELPQPRADPVRELQGRLAVEKARRVAAQRDRDEALAWIRRLEEGVATVNAAGQPVPDRALATAAPRQVGDAWEGERRELSSLTKALERLPPLRRAIIYAEIIGPPASLRPDVWGLGQAGY